MEITTIRADEPPASRTTSRSTVIRPILSSAPPMGMTMPAPTSAVGGTGPSATVMQVKVSERRPLRSPQRARRGRYHRTPAVVEIADPVQAARTLRHHA